MDIKKFSSNMKSGSDATPPKATLGFSDDEIATVFLTTKDPEQALEMIMARRTRECDPDDDGQTLLKKCSTAWQNQLTRVRKIVLSHPSKFKNNAFGSHIRKVLHEHGHTMTEENREALRRLAKSTLHYQYLMWQKCKRCYPRDNPPVGEDARLRTMVAELHPCLLMMDRFKLTEDCVAARDARARGEHMSERKEKAPAIRHYQMKALEAKAVDSIVRHEQLLLTIQQMGLRDTHIRQMVFGLFNSLMIVTGRKPHELVGSKVAPMSPFREVEGFPYMLEFQQLKLNGRPEGSRPASYHNWRKFPVLAPAKDVLRAISILRELEMPAPHGRMVKIPEVSAIQRQRWGVAYFPEISDPRVFLFANLRTIYGHLAFDRREESQFMPFEATKLQWLSQARCHESRRLCYVYDTITILPDDEDVSMEDTEINGCVEQMGGTVDLPHSPPRPQVPEQKAEES